MDTFAVVLHKDYGVIDKYNQSVMFSLVSDDNRQVSYFMVCRDYLQEIIQAGYIGESKTVCRTKYEKEQEPAREHIKIMMTYGGAENIDAQIEQLQNFLHQAETALGLELTQIFNVKHPNRRIFLFIGDKTWVSAPPMLSMYTLFLRTGLHHAGGNFRDTLNRIADGTIKVNNSDDPEYIRESERAFRWAFDEVNPKLIFSEDVKGNFTVPMPDNSWNMHSNSGIVAWSKKKMAKKIWPQWYKTFNREKRKQHATDN